MQSLPAFECSYCDETSLNNAWIAHRFFCKPEIPWNTEVELTLSGVVLKGAKINLSDWEVFFFAIEETAHEPTFSTIAECLDDLNDQLINHIRLKSSVTTKTIIQKLKAFILPSRTAALENNSRPLINLLDKLEQMTSQLFEEIGNLEIPSERGKRRAFFKHLKKVCALNKWLKALEIHSEAQIVRFDKPLDTIDPKNLSCASYALLKTGELRGADFIFKKDQWNIIRELPKYLKEWGYVSVKEPKAGDLVLYYLDHTDAPRHVGVYLSSNLIQSKLGIINPYISTHHIYDVVSGYGKKVVFLRKAAT